MFGKNKTVSVQLTIMIAIDAVASLTTKKNVAIMVMTVLLGPT